MQVRHWRRILAHAEPLLQRGLLVRESVLGNNGAGHDLVSDGADHVHRHFLLAGGQPEQTRDTVCDRRVQRGLSRQVPDHNRTVVGARGQDHRVDGDAVDVPRVFEQRDQTVTLQVPHLDSLVEAARHQRRATLREPQAGDGAAVRRKGDNVLHAHPPRRVDGRVATDVIRIRLRYESRPPLRVLFRILHAEHAPQFDEMVHSACGQRVDLRRPVHAVRVHLFAECAAEYTQVVGIVHGTVDRELLLVVRVQLVQPQVALDTARDQDARVGREGNRPYRLLVILCGTAPVIELIESRVNMAIDIQKADMNNYSPYQVEVLVEEIHSPGVVATNEVVSVGTELGSVINQGKCHSWPS